MPSHVLFRQSDETHDCEVQESGGVNKVVRGVVCADVTGEVIVVVILRVQVEVVEEIIA